MPARKTLAVASTARTRQRQRIALLVAGAVPVLIVLIVAAVLGYRHFTALGPDEMPSSIGAGEREDIQKTIEAFYDGVNVYNPQTASETMLSLDDIGRGNMQRVILEIAALQSGKLAFDVESLGTTTLDAEGERVSARVLTNYGLRDFVLTRQDGQWRVAEAPDLIVSQDAWPTTLSWDITNSYFSDDGNTLFVVGNIKNVGDVPGYMMTVGGFITDENGDTLQTNRPPVPGSPFLDPGQEIPFLISLGQPPGATFDPARVVVVPDFRAVEPGSSLAFKKKLDVAPSRLTWQPGVLSYTLSNTEGKDYPVAVYGYFRDASGKLLAVALVGGGLIPQGAVVPGQFDRDHLAAPKALPAAVSGIASIDLVAVQTAN